MSKGWRLLKEQERKKRGCVVCEHVSSNAWQCPFEVCPYRELDAFDRFQDYLKANEGTVPQIIRKLKGKPARTRRNRRH